MSTGPSAKVRQAVLERDGFRCVSCGKSVHGSSFSIHHRIARKMGGTRRPWINMPGNLITLCGSGTTGCHHWVESHRVQARAWGYLCYDTADPALVAVYTADGYVLFDNDACVRHLGISDTHSAEKQAELASDIQRGIETRTKTGASS